MARFRQAAVHLANSVAAADRLFTGRRKTRSDPNDLIRVARLSEWLLLAGSVSSGSAKDLTQSICGR